MLEDLGGGLGVTDPVSGEAVVKMAGERKPNKRAVATRAKATRPAKRARK